ncbi:hypothetical protein M2161_006422 [Streptomyces sp. SAI-133]|nr:hypothetical protein [Streptomyces sp. SAI-133]
MSCGYLAGSASQHAPPAGGPGVAPGKCSILARTANKDVGDVL